MATSSTPGLKRILVASGNPKKLREFQVLLSPLGIEIVDPVAVGGLEEVIEDQPSFRGNALKKARAAAAQTGMAALADDSGLAVDALDGAPGVFSARYAGEPSDDERNNAKLLRELEAVPADERGAHFVCALALVDAEGEVLCEVAGKANGEILTERRGTHDFGYDPLFLFTEPGFAVTGKAFAELTPLQKASVSHRGRAVQLLADFLSNPHSDAPSTRSSDHR